MPRRENATDPQAGFTLVELMITFVLTIAFMGGLLTLLDSNNKLARSQTYIAGMQQALRSGQYEMMRTVRMAGRGGLPRGSLPQGLAVAVRNDAAPSGDQHHIAVGDTGSPEILAGTDVLVVRGAISGSVYQINPLAGGFAVDSQTAPTSGSIRILDPHPTTGIRQDLAPLIDAVENDPHGALLLVSPIDVWAVVEIDKTASDITTDPQNIVIGFRVGTVGGPEVRDSYIELSGGFPTTLRTVAHVALLEEYRYYVREERAVAGDATSALVPRLVKARFFPATELPHATDTEFGVEIADNVFDLQIALGVDTDGDGVIDEGPEPDDWLYNSASDTNADGDPVDPAQWNPPVNPPPLAHVRLTTLARTDRGDLGYLAPPLGMIEDKDYSEMPHNVFNAVSERRYRRRLLQTVVDLRNL